jgi:hypothetical protein
MATPAYLRHLCAAAAVATLTMGSPALAKTQALLIGASGYVNLPPQKSLSAPKNDVRRMRAALLALGVKPEDMDLYADGVEGSKGDPTAAAILAAFDALPARVADGDQVVVYMSGHGTQIPDDNGDEDDGRDEAFLPVDAIPPKSGAARFDMDNVIRDDRIGELIDALRSKGAHVWLVVDSCHSGTISRAATGESRAKEISAADFGLPAQAATPAAPGGAGRNSMADSKTRDITKGSLVAFYASQADEISLELAMPPGAPPEKQTWVSAFSDAMMAVLQRGGVASYRELLAEVSRHLRGQIPPRTTQTPGFDGDGMDRPVLGGPAAARPSGFTVENDRVEGGLIAGLEPGTVLALYERADAEQPVGYAQVTQADALAARVVAVDYPCARKDGVPQCERRNAGDELTKARTSRIAVPVTRLILRISKPRDWPEREPPADQGEVEAKALARLADDPGVVIDDERPDFVWYRTAGGMRFVPSWIAATQEEFGPAASYAKAAGADEAAARVVAALSRARMLLRLERVRTALPSTGLPIGVASAKTSLVRYERDANGRCRFTGQRTTLDQSAAVATCDGAVVELRNGGTTPVFAYVFVLDDSWNLHPLGNSCRQGAQNRIDIGGSRNVELQYRNGTIEAGLAPRARNGVVVFAVPFEPGIALPVDPCQFVRAAGSDARRSTDGADDPVEAMLMERKDTRSSGRASAIGQLVMSVETWPVEQGRRN